MRRFSIVFKRLFIQGLLWLALFLAMGASLSHVAYTFNRFERVDYQAVGWLAAIGVDLGLVCLAIGIQRYRQTGRAARTLWAGLLFVTAISVLANVSHGVHVVTNEHLSAASFANFDVVETVTMLLLAGCLPVLVFALTEVAASDTGAALEAIQRETKRLDRQQGKRASTEGKDGFPMPIEQARELRRLNAEQAAAGLWLFITTHPDLAGLSYGQIGDQYGRSRSWVSDKLRTWTKQGAIERVNGNVNVLVTERPEQEK